MTTRGPKPVIKDIRIRHVPEAAVRVAGLKAGEFDLITAAPPETYRAFPRASRFSWATAKHVHRGRFSLSRTCESGRPCCTPLTWMPCTRRSRADTGRGCSARSLRRADSAHEAWLEGTTTTSEKARDLAGRLTNARLPGQASGRLPDVASSRQALTAVRR